MFFLRKKVPRYVHCRPMCGHFVRLPRYNVDVLLDTISYAIFDFFYLG